MKNLTEIDLDFYHILPVNAGNHAMKFDIRLDTSALEAEIRRIVNVRLDSTLIDSEIQRILAKGGDDAAVELLTHLKGRIRVDCAPLKDGVIIATVSLSD